MTVKDRVGRQRYIGFLVESQGHIDREDFGRALAEAARSVPGAARGALQLTVFDGKRGIVRVPHRFQREAAALLNSLRMAGREPVPVRVRTVVASGTICKVRARMGIPPSKRRPWERKGRRQPQKPLPRE